VVQEIAGLANCYSFDDAPSDGPVSFAGSHFFRRGLFLDSSLLFSLSLARFLSEWERRGEAAGVEWRRETRKPPPHSHYTAAANRT